MITPAKSNWKLAVIYVKDLDNYIAVYDQSSSGACFEIDGGFLPLSYNNKNVILDKESLDKVVVKRTYSTLTHYEDKDGVKMSIAEYNAVRDSLRKHYDSEYEEWDNIDDEYEFKKFDARWNSKHETHTVYEKPEIVIVEVQISTGSKYIKPIWAISSLPDEKRMFTLDVFSKAKAAFTEVCKKYEAEFEIPTHSGMQYARVMGDYLFAGTGDKFKNPTFGTLDTLKQAEKNIEKEIENAVSVIVAKKRGIALEQATIGSLHKDLVGMRANLYKLEVMKKSVSGRSELLKDVNRLIGQLEQMSVEKLSQE